MNLLWEPLTNEAPQPHGPPVRRSAAAEEVNGHPWEGDAHTDQRVDGVAVERHHHQEDREEAENDGVQETELWEEEREGEGMGEVVLWASQSMFTS